MAHSGTGTADNGNPSQLFFHDPLELDGQVTINQENVERALMVGYQDVGLLWFDVVTAFNRDLHSEHNAVEFGPEHCQVSRTQVAEAHQRDDDQRESNRESREPEKRYRDEPSIAESGVLACHHFKRLAIILSF